jgi:hypothetical protein
MHKTLTRVILAAAMVLALGSAVRAQSTRHVTYQGRLTDAGVPSNGTFSFDFGIFDAAAGGNLLWSETLPSVTVTQGLFTVVLGQTVPLDPATFNGSPRWLEIRVQGTTLAPRQELSSSPGAIYATLAGDFRNSLGGEVTGPQTTTVVTNAVPTNTSNAIVRRDGAGNFAAGTITAALNGNATTATTATSFSGPLTGEVTGTQGATVVSNAVPTNTPNRIVRRDGSGSFAAGTITLAGNLFLTNGNLDLPNTSSGSVGVVTKAGNPFLHNFGTNNTFVGYFAGNTSLTGGGNTGVGHTALDSTTTGFSNTAIGASTLVVNTTGNSNTAVGASALNGNTTGSSNSAFGAQALLQNTGSGSSNSAFGSSAMALNTTGSQNTAVGASALASNTTGTQNTAVGLSALFANTTASSNSAFGYQALTQNTGTGNSNSAFGYHALQNNTTGSFNDAFGWEALAANTTGFTNSAFGHNALRNNLASDIAAFGANALYSNTTGGENCAFGSGALFLNTVGGGNAAFGNGALENNTSNANSAFGDRALFANTNGFSTTAVGYHALESFASGSFNAAFGSSALQALTGGSFNIAIGNSAGATLTGGNSNIYIGNAGAANESNTIRIGAVQTSTFFAGIFGQVSPSGVAVLIDSSGKLGTTVSSRRYKDGIADLAGESDVLMKLRPVAFYYRPEYDETHTRQYGLVAEEVAEVAPQLVVYDDAGAPQSVRYHFVNAMLLNEVQNQRRRLKEQASRIEDLEARLARLEARTTEGR